MLTCRQSSLSLDALVVVLPFSTGRVRSTRNQKGLEAKQMVTGSIKRLVRERGFGFIVGDDGQEYFFHRGGLDNTLEFDALNGGERVTFDVERSEKGLRARQVRAA
jgi:CspA family cold shock protein